VVGSGSFRQSISGEDGFACKALIFVLAQFRTQNRFALLPELLEGDETMAKKTPEQLAREFEGRKAKGLAKGGAAFWPNILANAVLKLTQQREAITPAALIALVEREGETADVQVKAGAAEAVARLKQAIAKGA
jgi:hypothetical protein